MNDYGARALEHWQRARPVELATIADPERFFTDLGRQIQAEIQRRVDSQELPESDDFLETFGLLNAGQAAVESDVMREMVYLTEETAAQAEPAS